MSLLERLFFFHQEVLSHRFPNSSTISEHFEVSTATAKRDITYLRERLLAPLAYDAVKHGFYYSEDGFVLPFQESPKIIFLLTMLNKLAREAGLAELEEVKALEKRLSRLVSDEYETLIDSLYCEWIEVESIESAIFESVVEALVKNRLLQFSYSPIGQSSSRRRVAPLQLMNYQGRWYIFGYCFLRNSERLFHLARISGVEVTNEPIPQGLAAGPEKTGSSFGIFQGKPQYTAEILFTDTAADLVKNQHWHKEQVLQEHEDGLLLKLPVSDDRELLMKILQYGRKARVIAPPILVARISQEIGNMVQLYDDTTKKEDLLQAGQQQ